MTTNPVALAIAQAWPAGPAHAFLRPSAAARWVVCPGSALMESRYPEQGDKDAAAEGTAAHWVFAQMLDGWAPEVLMQEGKAPNGAPLTLEMMEAAQLIVDDIRAVQHECIGPTSPVVEQRVAIRRVHPSANEGTPDVRMWTADPFTGEAALYVWDFKYGHKYVDAFENWQLLDYAAGILDERPTIPEDRITLVLRVVQPRSYHRDGPIREWRLRATDLAPYVFRLTMSAEDATQPEPECRPQPDACENCTARHACDALQRAAYRGMDLARQAQASDLPPSALGLEMRYLTDAQALMSARLTGLQAQADALRMRGEVVPHWRAEAGSAREKWNVSAAEVLCVGQMLGLDLAQEPEPITPTQARALAKRKGVSPDLFGVYAVRPSGAVRLVPDDGAEARKVFAKSP